jgi:hypothetical protein
VLVDGEEDKRNANIAGFGSKYGGFTQVDEYCCECKECRERASLGNVLHVVTRNEIFEM